MVKIQVSQQSIIMQNLISESSNEVLV